MSPTERIPAWALAYDSGDHPPFAYTADVLGLTVDGAAGALDVLLIERGGEPFRGRVAVPGGFVAWEGDETARDAALRELREETGVGEPDYIEVLDTYDANGRDPRQFAGRLVAGRFVRRGNRVVSRTDLALFRDRHRARPTAGDDAAKAFWAPVGRYLPWEDIRSERGRAARDRVTAALDTSPAAADDDWAVRVAKAFGPRLDDWNEERAGERLRLMIRAGVVEEALRDRWGQLPDDAAPLPGSGEAMAFDHRLMLADALGRLRGKIKYVPELLVALTPPLFTIAGLQGVVELIAGRPLEAANFRRLLAHSKHHALIRPTGSTTESGGRPAELFTWRRDYAHERLERSLRLPWLPLDKNRPPVI
ncbi:MAG TPA: NUDIX domain-containing protein [Gemmatimonadota bacterium]|nr:NUDIX domain-containing protein [Gemmatimonadota bacterium]